MTRQHLLILLGRRSYRQTSLEIEYSDISFSLPFCHLQKKRTISTKKTKHKLKFQTKVLHICTNIIDRQVTYSSEELHSSYLSERLGLPVDELLVLVSLICHCWGQEEEEMVTQKSLNKTYTVMVQNTTTLEFLLTDVEISIINNYANIFKVKIFNVSFE